MLFRGSSQGFEETPFTYVDTAAGLQCMAERLAAAQEVALDLEHHSHRSFQGITCLMQISTRSEDFVVDTIALRSDLGVRLPGSSSKALVQGPRRGLLCNGGP